MYKTNSAFISGPIRANILPFSIILLKTKGFVSRLSTIYRNAFPLTATSHVFVSASNGSFFTHLSVFDDFHSTKGSAPETFKSPYQTSTYSSTIPHYRETLTAVSILSPVAITTSTSDSLKFSFFTFWFWFESILHNQETQKFQVTFDLFSLRIFNLVSTSELHVFASKCNYSVTFFCMLLHLIVIVCWNTADAKRLNNFWCTFNIPKVCGVLATNYRRPH